MPDFGSPVAQNVNVNPNQGIQTLSGLLGLQQQRQALQGQAAEVQQQQQTAGQRAGIASFMSTFDPTKHVGSDGTLDLDNVLTDPNLRRAAGDQFPQLMQQLVSVKQAQLQAKQQLVNLNDSARTQFQNTLGGLRTDPDVIADNPQGREKVQRAIGQFSATGPDAGRVAQIYGTAIDHAPQGKLAQTLSNMQLQAMDAGSQAASQRPAYQATGATQTQVNPPAAGGAPAGNLRSGISPQYIFDPVSKTYYAAPGTGGGATAGTPTAPAAIPNAPAASPGAAGLPHYTPGESETLAESTAQVSAARKAGDQVGVNRDINQRILALNKQTATGPGTDFVHQAAAAAGLPAGSSYQELGAFLDRQAAMASQSMGLPETNMGIETAKQFTGNTKYNNQVIADKTKFVDALNTAAGAYRAGVDRVVGTGPNPNMGAFPQFRATWAKNFDPEVFAYENAVKTGDVEEQRSIEQAEGQKGMAQLLKKRVALMGLVNGSAGQ